MNAKDFGISGDPDVSTEDDVRPYRGLSPAERYCKFLDLMRFMERVLGSLDASHRAHYDQIQQQLDDPGRWRPRTGRRLGPLAPAASSRRPAGA